MKQNISHTNIYINILFKAAITSLLLPERLFPLEESWRSGEDLRLKDRPDLRRDSSKSSSVISISDTLRMEPKENIIDYHESNNKTR